MGNQITFYQGDKELVFINNVVISSFQICNSNLSLSNVTLGPRMADWESVDYNNGDGTYNLLFRYKPSGSYSTISAGYYGTTVLPLLVFSTVTALTIGLITYWVNDETNKGDVSVIPAYNSPYVMEDLHYSSSSGGGDPHVIPYFNDSHNTYLLPTDESIYTYFDNLDNNERFIINAKLWVLDNIFLHQLEKMRNKHKPEYFVERENIEKHHKTPPYHIEDTSFSRYIAFIYKTETIYDELIIDIETLETVKYTNDDDVNNFKLLKENNNHDIFKISEKYKDADHIYYPNNIKTKYNDETICRKMIINTIKLGNVEIILSRQYNKPNHRNHISLLFKERHKLIKKNCCGALIDIETLEKISSLIYISDDIKTPVSNITCLTLQQFIKNKNQNNNY